MLKVIDFSVELLLNLFDEMYKKNYVVYCCYLLTVYVLSTDRLPPAGRRGYTSVFNAIKRIAAEEGVATLWRVGILHLFITPL